jgi:hypothetical protein
MKLPADARNLTRLVACRARWFLFALAALAAALWCVMMNPRGMGTPAAGRTAAAEKEQIEAQILALSRARERFTRSYCDALIKKTAAQIGYDNACLAKEEGQNVAHNMIPARTILAIRRIQLKIIGDRLDRISARHKFWFDAYTRSCGEPPALPAHNEGILGTRTRGGGP